MQSNDYQGGGGGDDDDDNLNVIANKQSNNVSMEMTS